MKLIGLLEGRWIKYAEPVLCLGKTGEWDDLMADCPSIYSDEAEKFYLFYTGHSTRSPEWAIGFAESNDLFHWKKFSDNPVLSSGDSHAWDQRIDGPALFKHKNSYYLFYEAAPSVSFRHSPIVYAIPYFARKRLGSLKRLLKSLGSAPKSQVIEHARGRCIGFAVSDNLLNWKKYAANPILMPSDKIAWDSEGVFSPFVLLKNDLFYLFYGGSNGQKICSGIAVSDDLCRWKKEDKAILAPGPEGSWDDNSTLVISVIKLEDAYVAFYEGQNARNKYAIGFAYSYDFKTWIKYDRNPILEYGSQGDIDERMVNSPHVFLNDDQMYLFYGSQDFKMQGHSSLAYLEAK